MPSQILPRELIHIKKDMAQNKRLAHVDIKPRSRSCQFRKTLTSRR